MSTDKQADSGAGLAAQEAAIRAECQRRGWDLLRISTDTGSGKAVASRVALTEALLDLDSGKADALVAHKLDRVARSVPDFSNLMARALQRGWSLVMMDPDVDTTTPSGRLVAHIMSALAEWEREVIGQRTKDAMAAKKAEGVHCGRRRTLDQEVRDRIVAESAAGRSYGAIARQLNEEAVPTAQGGSQWYPSTVRLIAAAA